MKQNKEQFDMWWKGQCYQAAVKEQLEAFGKLKIAELFKRARVLYNKGYQYEINEWESHWDKKEETAPAQVEKKEVITSQVDKIEVRDGLKKCPGCGENVPVGWARHTYKRDGSCCNHIFGK